MNPVKNKGFTLIELLVVSWIIIFMSSVVLINWKAGNQGFLLQRSAHSLAQDIRRAAAMAMAAEECVPCPGPTVIPDRYAVEFFRGIDNYFLFADLNDNGTYQSSPDVKIETIYLEKGVIISDLVTNASKSAVWVAFKPPSPSVAIRDPGSRQTLRIELQLISDPSRTKSIIVNAAGLIEVE